MLWSSAWSMPRPPHGRIEKPCSCSSSAWRRGSSGGSSASRQGVQARLRARRRRARWPRSSRSTAATPRGLPPAGAAPAGPAGSLPADEERHQDRVDELAVTVVVSLPVALSLEAERLVQPERRLVPGEDVELELPHADCTRPGDGFLEERRPHPL